MKPTENKDLTQPSVDPIQDFTNALKHKKPEPPPLVQVENAKPLDQLTPYVVALTHHFKSKGGGIVKLGDFVDTLRASFPESGTPELTKRIQPGVETTQEVRNALFASVRAILDRLGVQEWGSNFPPKYRIPQTPPVYADGKIVSFAKYEIDPPTETVKS